MCRVFFFLTCNVDTKHRFNLGRIGDLKELHQTPFTFHQIYFPCKKQSFNGNRQTFIFSRHVGDNLIQYMPAALRSSDVLPALTQLIMMNNHVTFLEAGTFTNLTTLNYLYAIFCNMHFNSYLKLNLRLF